MFKPTINTLSYVPINTGTTTEQPQEKFRGVLDKSLAL